MALNLTVKVGGCAYVAGRPLYVVEADDLSAIVRTDDGQEHYLDDRSGVEVYPDVMVSVGLKSYPGAVSLLFTAPRYISIWREGFRGPKGDAYPCCTA